tara:strand:+ start:47559 stop:47876 length:318 start_codon:yes stop_codon:yes gene_type:complete
MVKYGANSIEYSSRSVTSQHAIFSEIYYPKGWNCYINGKLTSNFRANYILRGVTVPAGENKIEWRFEPQSFYKAKTASLIGSTLLLLSCLFVFGIGLKPLFGNKK